MYKTIKDQLNYVQHFSTRIPWKDNDYTGRIDDNPKLNTAAQTVPNIGESRNLDFEEQHRGKSYIDAGIQEMKNWITENAAFMSGTELEIKMKHPYSTPQNEKFRHFIETNFKLKPYSFLLRPFSWTLKNKAVEKNKHYNFYFNFEETNKMLKWNSSWVSHGESQKGIFKYFFSGIKPNESLIFPYYKQVPFIEDDRRIIAGIGNIIERAELNEYTSDGTAEEKNYIWETNIAHSIRNNGKNGFLMPYLEISKYAKDNPEFDVSSVTLFEPAGFREEFSYTAEWVSYDAAIDVLNQAKNALHNIAELNLKTANHVWVNTQLKYVEEQLKNVWNQRGVFPGLGSALSAFGTKYGFDISRYIDTSKNGLITELELYFTGKKETGDQKLDESLAEKENEFLGILKDKSKSTYFELLSRINLSIEQAEYAWKNLKDKAAEIIENPYRLFELTRKEENPIAISQIDNAVFINSLVENKHPLEKPSKMRTESDKRRFRAMTIFVLGQASNKGHTLLNFNQTIHEIGKLPLDRRTDFQVEIIDGIIEFLQEELYIDNENKYIKLKEYQEYKEVIVDVINRRLNSNLEATQDWGKIIGKELGVIEENNEKDKKARAEKEKALKILETSKISVLLGRAGTGKTTALGIFSSSNEIKKGGVLALTPTGKARIQLENSFRRNGVEAEFMTIAQFLIRYGGFSWNTMSYQLPTKAGKSEAKTVIIDESSMLTEAMFAGVLKLVEPHAVRIIFTGDQNQLPPIGAGRPFTDLIGYLKKKAPNNVAELKTEMKHIGDGLSFAQIFSNYESVDKDVIYRIQNNKTDKNLKYIQYSDEEELEQLFFDEIVKTANMKDVDDIQGFDKSLGATHKVYTNYTTSKHIEDWQILSPTKFVGTGTYYLNNQIHQKYRQDIVEKWNKYPFSKHKPQSDQNIVYGDKVISVINEEKECWNQQTKHKEKEYIANGEIGIMVGFPQQYGKNDKNTRYYNFMFGSFDGKVFSYEKKDFGGESNNSYLELAYALTVHKSQGSGFGKTIAVINGKSSFLSKELLYTAFSRQKEKLTILSGLTVEELVQYANDWYSDTKQRYTDLFEVPNIIEIESGKQKRYFEEKLIHKTTSGIMVRSKSEVIVADILDKLGIDYKYEKTLEIKGKKYIPDFTLSYQGKNAYLEHLGMLGNTTYNEHWQEKKENYSQAGISEENGNLIITQDGQNGSLDAAAIESKIKMWQNS